MASAHRDTIMTMKALIEKSQLRQTRIRRSMLGSLIVTYTEKACSLPMFWNLNAKVLCSLEVQTARGATTTGCLIKATRRSLKNITFYVALYSPDLMST